MHQMNERAELTTVEYKIFQYFCLKGVDLTVSSRRCLLEYLSRSIGYTISSDYDYPTDETLFNQLVTCQYYNILKKPKRNTIQKTDTSCA